MVQFLSLGSGEPDRRDTHETERDASIPDGWVELPRRKRVAEVTTENSCHRIRASCNAAHKDLVLAANVSHRREDLIWTRPIEHDLDPRCYPNRAILTTGAMS